MKKLIIIATLIILGGCAHDIAHRQIPTSTNAQWLCDKKLYNKTSIGGYGNAYYVDVFRKELGMIDKRLDELGYECNPQWEAVRVNA